MACLVFVTFELLCIAFGYDKKGEKLFDKFAHFAHILLIVNIESVE